MRLFVFYLFKSDVYKEEICLVIRYSKYEGHFKGNASCFILTCDVLNEDVHVRVIEVEPFYKWPIIVVFFINLTKWHANKIHMEQRCNHWISSCGEKIAPTEINKCMMNVYGNQIVDERRVQ